MGTAKSKDEAINTAAAAIADERATRIQKAAAMCMQAGYMLSKAYERLEKGQYNIEDLIVLGGSSAQISAAASIVAQVLHSHEVQPATVADQKVLEGGQESGPGLILQG